MERQTILKAVFFSFACLVMLVIWKYNSNLENAKQIDAQIGLVPNIQLSTLTNEPLLINSIAQDHSLLLIYFNSECDMCRLEIAALEERLSDFSDIQIILASSQGKEEVNEYLKNSTLVMAANINVVTDENFLLSDYLGIKSVPSAYCYSNKGELLAKYNGPVKIEVLLQNFGKKKEVIS